MMWSDRLSHFELPPQWSTMREAAQIERETGRRIIHMEKGDYASAELMPPQEAFDAFSEALARGYVRYSPGPGLEQAQAINAAAARMGKKARIHVELDTGMGRLGFLPGEDALDAVTQIAGLPHLELAGLFTHCPYTNESNEEGIRFTERQFQAFSLFVRNLRQRGVDPPLTHVCNSQGIVHYRQMHLEMVRAGILLYCSYPLFQDVLPLKPVLSLKAKVAYIKTLGPGENVSYGRTYTTVKKTTVATLPLGYADGYNRLLTNRGEVLIRGKRVPLIGTICMDQCMADITSLNGQCSIGDEVVFLGRQGDEEITVEEMAQKICGFINYEYLVTLQGRVPRVYTKGGRVVQVVNRLLG